MEKWIALYGPIPAAVLMLIYAWRIKWIERPVITVSRWDIELALTNRTAARLSCLLAALLIVPYYVFIDMTQFFPRYLQMDVFFDEVGIKKRLAMFDDRSLEDVGYREGAERRRHEYYRELDERRRLVTGHGEFFTAEDGRVHSHGSTTFVVEQGRGPQEYVISDVEGRLEHIYERRDGRTERFLSFFSKVPSSHDYIAPSLYDIFIKRSAAIQPRFRQVIADYGRTEGVQIDHMLIGMTNVWFWPVPGFSDTVYFFQGADGVGIPIGYAIYR